MAAAVADYRVENPHPSKIKKSEDSLTLNLVKNPDILKTLSLNKQAHQFCVGFALETQNGADYARKKLVEKQLDAIVLNIVSEVSGFGVDSNQVQLFDKNNRTLQSEVKSKEDISVFIVETLNDWIFE
jgi:phosphopantothenoylcysteine decarboxylase/phosphopantothenate--cysteine ligase